jgi:hypothetical protein
MEGSTSLRSRRALVLERAWKLHRLASQCQAQAYQRVVPERSVSVVAAVPAAKEARGGAEVVVESVGVGRRLAAGGRP